MGVQPPPGLELPESRAPPAHHRGNQARTPFDMVRRRVSAPGRRRATRRSVWTAAFVVVAVMLVPGIPEVAAAAGAAHVASPAAYSLVNYVSSVDGVNLSYYQWLPDGFSNSTAHPLAVYLHGLGADGTELFTLNGGLSAIAAAQADGFILISLNTRTGDGFYVNSPYSGPQQQDVLDAIASEKSRHQISGVYLFGSSMGADGSWSIAGNVPGLVAGLGSISSCPDSFEGLYWHSLHSIDGYDDYLNTTGGQGPSTSYFQAQTYYLSAARFYPQNYTGIALYGVQGGNDDECPNNPAFYGYQQANNTFLNSTCLVIAQWGEPANCQTPFANLSAAHPGEYRWRFDYAPTGLHSLNELNGTDLFDFWMGTEPGGLVCAPVSGGPPTSCPTESVTFVESGLTSGTWNVTVNGSVEAASAGAPVQVDLSQGWHTYEPASLPGFEAQASGWLLVAGQALIIEVTYIEGGYFLAFLETGLPTGTMWSVTVDTSSESSTTSTISFSEPSGTYAYSLGVVSGYRPGMWSGTTDVPGLNESVTIAWTPVVYMVWFNQSGLPLDVQWEFSIEEGSAYLNSTLSDFGLELSVSNGTYWYSAMGPDTYVSVPATPVVVAGANDAVDVRFVARDGEVAGVVLPVAAAVSIGGVPVLVSGGMFAVNESPGTYAVQAFATGYVPFYSNITVTSLAQTWVYVALVLQPATPSPEWPTSSLEVVAGGTIAAVAIAAVLLWRRGVRTPPRHGPRADE
jgi:pimeloyl-ACP methyl ester carboxylesterase